MKNAWILLAGVGLLLGCPDGAHPSGSSSGGTTGCTPGTQQACACGGGGQGLQVCNSAGTAFEVCQACAGGTSSYTSQSASSGAHAASSLTHGTYTYDADTVTDSGTGLTWQRVVPPDRYSWADAKAYCIGLSLAGAAAWRLPWLEELQRIVDPDNIPATGPTINQTAFPNTLADRFWSASPFVGASNRAWVVFFGDGNPENYDAIFTFRVRCVR